MATDSGADALLRGPVAEDRPDERWAYTGKAAALVSLFILYHLLALLQHTTPSVGFSAQWSRGLAAALRIPQYMRFTSSVQSWAMFAPNPHRTNAFLQVKVDTVDGYEYDLRHDIYGRRDYPYFFYDRFGKINRRLLEQDRYQRPYAAWVCREWALQHDGVAPVRVKFTKMWTKVPEPSRLYGTMGFDPYRLTLHKEKLQTYDCAKIPHGQLPDHVRARHGLPPLPEGAFVDVPQNTWWDRAQAKQRIIEKRRAADVGQERERERERERDDEPPSAEVAGAAEGGGD